MSRIRGLPRLGSVVAATGVVAIIGTAPGQTRSVEPHTLVSVNGEITAFAQDSMRIAWLAPSNTRGRFVGCTRAIVVRTVTTGRQIGLLTRRSLLCSRDVFAEDVLSLAGDRAVYVLRTGLGLSEEDGVS